MSKDKDMKMMSKMVSPRAMKAGRLKAVMSIKKKAC